MNNPASERSPLAKSMRTPLSRVRGLGTSGGATRVFWRQRLTSVALLPLVIVFIAVVLSLRGATHAEAIVILANPMVAILMLAMVIALAWHMKLGMQVVIEDYIHAEGPRLAALIANTFFSGLVGLAAVFALLKIAFGG
jgi:succinate dehydrogenase / fumarate reductase, membrane anchor subunit